jgi:ABC-type microcin C transport system permease subunit YejE
MKIIDRNIKKIKLGTNECNDYRIIEKYCSFPFIFIIILASQLSPHNFTLLFLLLCVSFYVCMHLFLFMLLN